MSLLLFTIFAILLSLFKMSNKRRPTMECYKFRPFVYQMVAPRGDVVPLARSGHRVVADNANLYSFGGYNPLIDETEENTNSYPLFQELWRFNFASCKWTKICRQESLPQELASNAVVRHGNFLMVYGGTGSPFGHRCSNQLHIGRLNDAKNDMWAVSTTGQPPTPQYGQALVYTSGYLYAVGGTTGFEYTCDIHRLNMKTLVWEPVYICQGRGDYEPAGRYRHEVAFDGDCIYILGGGTADEVYDFFEIPTFDLETNRWHKRRTRRDPRDDISGIPPPRRCHGAVQLDTPTGIQIFITGGYDGENIFDDLWKLELATLQWTHIDTCRLPRPMYFHSTAATPEGKLYVFGGIYIGNDVSRSNEVFSTWLCIPKLSELCWEAVLKYNRDIVNVKREDLIDAGLPRRFIERLE